MIKNMITQIKCASISFCFSTGIYGLFLCRNIRMVLMTIEIMFLSYSFNLKLSFDYLGDAAGQIFNFFALTGTAAESQSVLQLLYF
jgi:NADH:ubiquinone oxidoreductase subunit K